MNETLRTVVSWLVSNQSNYLFCGFILSVALVGGFWIWFKIGQLRRAFKKTVTTIEQVGSESAFVTAYPDLNDGLKAHWLLGPAWGEFSDTLIHPDANCRVFRNPDPPELYFNSSDIIGRGINLRLVTSIPNYLTGLGILGTFVGLAAGIYLAQEGLLSGDTKQSIAALGMLLSGAGLAFMTSICGLGASIVISYYEKLALRRVDNLVARWNAALEKCLRRVTPEQLAAAQVLETQRQTLQLERFNTDLAVSIAEALGAKLSATVGPKIDSVVSGLDGLRAQQVQFNEDVLTRVSTQLSTALTGAAGTEMREMGATLASLVETLRESARVLGEGQRQLVTTTDTLAHRLEAALGQGATTFQTETAKAIKKVVSYLDTAGQANAGLLESATKAASKSLVKAGVETSNHLQSATASFQIGAEKLSEVVAGLKGSTERQLEVAQVLERVLDQASEVQSQMRRTAEPLAVSANQLRAATESLDDRMRGLEGVSEALKAVAKDMKAAQEQTLEAWTDYQARFAEVDESLGNSFEQINEGVNTITQRYQEFVVGMDSELGKAVQGLGGVVEELNQVAEDLLESRGGKA